MLGDMKIIITYSDFIIMLIMDSFLEFTVAQKLEAGAGKLKINISHHLIFN